AWYVAGSQTPTQTWTLDSLGNNLSAGSYNAANEETPTGQSGNPYDTAGNTTTLRSGLTAVYDAWNRLKAMRDSRRDGAGYCAGGSYLSSPDRVPSPASSYQVVAPSGSLACNTKSCSNRAEQDWD
ncbi:MAG: hypothetical protein LLG00_12465, partial [Planctomycetaceae bacterium]|nr:hypothetical protein [Planctomycetaceae bacterium]